MESLYKLYIQELSNQEKHIYSRQTEMFNIILKKNHPKAYSNNLKDSHSKLEEKKQIKKTEKKLMFTADQKLERINIIASRK